MQEISDGQSLHLAPEAPPSPAEGACTVWGQLWEQVDGSHWSWDHIHTGGVQDLPHCQNGTGRKLYKLVNYSLLYTVEPLLNDTSEIRTPCFIRTLDWVPTLLCKYIFFPWNKDTSLIRTIILVPRVSVLERFHCQYLITLLGSKHCGVGLVSCACTVAIVRYYHVLSRKHLLSNWLVLSFCGILHLTIIHGKIFHLLTTCV